MNAHLESAIKRQDLNYKHLKKRHIRQNLMKLLAQMLLPSSQKHKYSNHSIPGYSRETNGGTVDRLIVKHKYLYVMVYLENLIKNPEDLNKPGNQRLL